MGPELPPRVTGYLWGGTQKLRPTGSDKWGCSANSYLQEQLMPWSQGHSPPQGDKCLSRSYPEFCLYLQNSLCVLPWASRCFCCLILPPPAPLTLRHLSVPTDAVKFLAAKVTQLTTVGSPCWNLPPSRIFALACPSALDSQLLTSTGIFPHSAWPEFRCHSLVFCLYLCSNE